MYLFRYFRRRSRLCIVACLLLCAYITMCVVVSNQKKDDGQLSSDDYIAHIDTKLIHRNKILDDLDRTPPNTESIDNKPKVLFKPKCQEKRNLVFIKCMKCATETMGTIIRRFGYTRNLSFVTPRSDKMYLGWPYLMNSFDYRPSSRGYNIIMEHSIYNKTVMEKLMPRDTVYISIIREPFSHVKSTINYFKIVEIAKIPGENPLNEYFHNLEKYESIYKSSASAKTRYCIPDNFSLTRNLMSHCHGMPVGFPADRQDMSHDPRAVHKYVRQLDKDFSLMMLVEYFDESLILLKRKMCWTFKDIIYKSVNSGNYKYKTSEPDPELVAIHKKWSPADYELYDYFHKTFWKEVGKQSSDFYAEVAEYQRVQAQAREFCTKGGNPVVRESEWSPEFLLDKAFCDFMEVNLLKKIQQRHDKDEKALLLREQSNYLLHKPQALC